jgi:hypothetical protein
LMIFEGTALRLSVFAFHVIRHLLSRYRLPIIPRLILQQISRLPAKRIAYCSNSTLTPCQQTVESSPKTVYDISDCARLSPEAGRIMAFFIFQLFTPFV